MTTPGAAERLRPEEKNGGEDYGTEETGGTIQRARFEGV